MITQWVMDLLHGLAATLSDWMQAIIPAPPQFIADMSGGFTTAYDVVPGSMKYFLPIGPLIVAGTALVGLLVILGAIRFARRVLSLFTGGGGNA